jgi:hypothetical protein
MSSPLTPTKAETGRLFTWLVKPLTKSGETMGDQR